jgi:hypothetical protein
VNENALLMYPRTHASGVKSHPSSTWEPPLVRTCPGKMCVKAIGGAGHIQTPKSVMAFFFLEIHSPVTRDVPPIAWDCPFA